MATQGYSFEPSPSNFNNLKNDAFSKQHEIAISRISFHTYSTISDNFSNGVDKYLIPGKKIRIRLTRSSDKFILLQPVICLDSSSFTIWVLNATLFAHLLELGTENFISLERALKKKVAQYEWQESLMTFFLITSLCWRQWNDSRKFCQSFRVINFTGDSNLRDITNSPELSGARLVIEFRFNTSTKQQLRVIVIAERRSVVLINYNTEFIKNSAIYNFCQR